MRKGEVETVKCATYMYPILAGCADLVMIALVVKAARHYDLTYPIAVQVSWQGRASCEILKQALSCCGLRLVTKPDVNIAGAALRGARVEEVLDGRTSQ